MPMCSAYNLSSDLVNNYSSLTGDYRSYSLVSMKYGQRLKLARKHAKLSQQGLADRIGNLCSQENISKLERGDATGSEYTAQFAEACGVRAMWLATEEGEMTDGLYVHDERIKHLVMVCQDLAAYDIDRLVQAGDALQKLGTKKHKPGQG